MSAVIDCLQFLPGGTCARWLLVHHPDALMAEAEFSWTRELSEATRFEDARADALKLNAPELPLLPTDPPIVPNFLRVVHGHYEEPERPAMKPDPALLEERARRHESAIDQTEASVAKKKGAVSPEEAFERLERRHLA